MEGGYDPRSYPAIHALIKGMEDLSARPPSSEEWKEQTILDIRESRCGRLSMLLRSIVVQISIRGMLARQTLQKFSRVDRDAGWVWVYQVSGVEGGEQAPSYPSNDSRRASCCDNTNAGGFAAKAETWSSRRLSNPAYDMP
jgi:hypothetical protein